MWFFYKNIFRRFVPVCFLKNLFLLVFYGTDAILIAPTNQNLKKPVIWAGIHYFPRTFLFYFKLYANSQEEAAVDAVLAGT